MPIGITEEHVALHDAVRGWVERHCPPVVPRALLDAGTEELPPFWDELAAQGWLGLHIDEASGGSGYGVGELVVVLEELGRCMAPGPVVPTALGAAVVASSSNDAAKGALLPGLAAGAVVAAVTAGPGCALQAERVGTDLVVRGSARPVLGGNLADVLVAPVQLEDEPLVWVALPMKPAMREELPSVDATRRVASVVVDQVTVPVDRQLDDVDHRHVGDLSATMYAAELVGVAQWCVDTASAYAKDRVQFGRPIGQFQGIKHKCADMVGRVELARAAAWDASRAIGDASDEGALAASAALSLALDAAFTNAKDCIQVLGGIGFTWEHDAHLYLKRAMAMRSLLGPAAAWRVRVCELALAGTRRGLTVDLGPAGDAVRAEVRAFLDDVKDLPAEERHRRVADAGYIVPTWPVPYGRGAKAVEQVVIEEEFRAAKVARPGIMVGGWALPPVIMYGTREQQERWIPPTLRGETIWCQLFSEPGAGSDLASLTTKATRVEGGWVVNGQKVWTSMAHFADWGILLARTNPDAPKHDGISCFMVDMKHTEGLDIRPLRELTGEAMFNEVFFNDAFLPDECLVGREHDGWRAARTTLANERVFMGSGMSFGHGPEQILKAIGQRDLGGDPLVLDEVGGLVATAHGLACLGFRLTLAALTGADPSGSEASVRKLLGVVHDQHVQEVGLGLVGAAGAIAEDEGLTWSRGFLFNRNLTIAGGTSEIQRNIIGERVLGLPRDP
jgi:alkylation response protein AidB-like acyl-CoA dehydrogenase